VIGSPTLVGKQLGPYSVEAFLGSGGMSSVYRGFDPKLQRSVAIKVLAGAAAAQPDFAARFRQEALLIASLHHPHIVHIYDFGQQDGYTYMVQELLPGPTLEQRLRDLATRGERMERQEILEIAAQLAAALDAAHAAGIIHRDVKPSNAMWNAAGTLVLTDFGIAKNMLTEAGQTQAGVVIGTPNYLSPEQAQGLPLTPASDIYALGAVVYEMIAGHPPFTGDTMRVVFDHVHTPPPSLHPARPELPPAVEAVVLRALAKDPAERFHSAGELARALERAWLESPAIAAGRAAIHSQPTQIWEGAAAAPPARPGAPGKPTPPIVAAPPRSGTRPLLLLVLGLLLVLLLLGGAVLALRGGASEPAGTAPSAAPAPPAAQEPALPTTAPATLAPTLQPTVAATPALSPAPQATAPPPPPSPIPQPTVPPNPAPPTDPDTVAQLRALLEAGTTDGRAGKDGTELLKKLDEVEQALAKGDAKKAQDRLRDLQKRVQEGVRKDTIEPQFAQQVLDGVAAIAGQYNLSLPPNDKPGRGSTDRGRNG
jgi:serine/threonine-protein kinase